MVNPYVSVDCVLLGFDGEQLNVLIVRQSGEGGVDSTGNYKLPGSLIDMDEDLDDAAQRVLHQLTGLSQVRMMQFKAFGDPHRLDDPKDKVWLKRFYQLERQQERLITIAYLSLLRIDRKMEKLEDGYEAQWMPISTLPHLAFDHSEIVEAAIKTIENATKLDHTMLFDLLPRKFTATQLRNVMESVAGIKCDAKNFHKKLATMPYIIPLDEKQEGVNHRAGRYFKFKRTSKSK